MLCINRKSVSQVVQSDFTIIHTFAHNVTTIVMPAMRVAIAVVRTAHCLADIISSSALTLVRARHLPTATTAQTVTRHARSAMNVLSTTALSVQVLCICIKTSVCRFVRTSTMQTQHITLVSCVSTDALCVMAIQTTCATR